MELTNLAKNFQNLIEREEKQNIEHKKELTLAQKTSLKQNTEFAEIEKLLKASKQRQKDFEAQFDKQNANIEGFKSQSNKSNIIFGSNQIRKALLKFLKFFLT